MYDYKMFCLGGNLVYLLENFGKRHSKISRFFLSHIHVKNTKIIVYKTVNLYFPLDKLYNIYGIFKCESYLYYDRSRALLLATKSESF